MGFPLRLAAAAIAATGFAVAATATTAAAAGPTLSEPLGLAVDRAGNLYVANVNAGVTVYNPAHVLIGQITSGVSLPTAVGVSFTQNRIYVANEGTNNVTIYNQAYQQIGTISDPTLGQPRSLFVDSSDDVWVLDYGGVLHVYLDNGTPIASVPLHGTAIGQFGSNWSIWGVPATNGGGYTQVFNNIGEALHNGFGSAVVGNLSIQAGGAAQDGLGQQYVTDQLGKSVIMESSDATTSANIISTGSAPYGIAVDQAHGKIYVGFPQTYQVAVYSLKPPYTLLHTIK